VQDAAASLPVTLFSKLDGVRALDMCAAPGGKTAQLIAAGAEVTALDRSPERLDTLRANLDRLSMSATIVAADAGDYATADPFDAVLLDAPCSATGTIRRHPDIPYRRTVKDIAALTAIQDRLLRQAVGLLKPGGELVYCTCSLEPEEGADRIAALLDATPDVQRLPLTGSSHAGIDDIVTAQGDLRTLPCHLPGDEPRLAGLDGFYAARLVKT